MRSVLATCPAVACLAGATLWAPLWMPLWMHGTAHAGDAGYADVPRVTAVDPAFFRARLEAARTGVVRIAMFGDSQETAPWGWGEHYIATLNARFAKVYGPAGESQLFTNHTAVDRPLWLATMRESPAAGPSAIAADAVPPAVTAQALRAGGASRTVFLHDASYCSSDALEGGAWFDRTGPFVAEVLAAIPPASIGLRWSNAPTAGDVPEDAAPVVQTGVFVADPKGGGGGGGTGRAAPLRWWTTPALEFNGLRHVQLALEGVSPKTGADVVGVRFRSVGAHRGVVLQSFARGGMRLPDLTAEHGASGAVLRALAPSIAVLHYGANDAGNLPAGAAGLEAWRAQLLSTIAWIRAELGDPAFPVVIAAEIRCNNGPAHDAVIDAMPAIAHAIALADARVLALNLRRVTEEEYGWGRTRRYLADGAHFRPYAQAMLGEAFVGELVRALSIEDPACSAGHWADCVRTWGASCQQGGCRMEPDFEVLQHGLPWQGAGTTCADADGDGFSDECPPGGPADFNRDGYVDAADLAFLLASWGEAGGAADLDGNGVVGGADLAAFLAAWGA